MNREDYMNQDDYKYQEYYMNKDKFVQEIKRELELLLCDGESVHLHTTLKNNGIRLMGIHILEKDKTIAPTFYLEDYYQSYQKGASLKALAHKLYQQSKACRVEQPFEMDDFTDYEKVKKHLSVRLINKALNEDRLKETVHVEYMDLAVVFLYLLDHKSLGMGTILIQNTHLMMWNITKDELVKQALENVPKLLPRRLLRLDKMLLEMLKEKDEAKHFEESLQANDMAMYVMTNERKTDGAATLLYPDSLTDAAKMLGGDFFVIPSSIHEVILVLAKDTGLQKKELNDMVKQVNATQLDPTEILSDHVYFYDSTEEKMYSMKA